VVEAAGAEIVLPPVTALSVPRLRSLSTRFPFPETRQKRQKRKAELKRNSKHKKRDCFSLIFLGFKFA
jgi:hypothetical protein